LRLIWQLNNIKKISDFKSLFIKTLNIDFGSSLSIQRSSFYLSIHNAKHNSKQLNTDADTLILSL